MDPFATPAELATYLQSATQAEADAGSGDVLDTGVATQALAAASGAIRAACGWSVTQETVSGTLSWHAGGCVFLPTLLLTAVSISVAGVPLTDGVDFTWSRNGVVSQFGGVGYGWGRRWLGVSTITYTHGYETAPEELKAVCLEQAAQRVLNPERMVSRSIGGVTDTYAATLLASDLSKEPRLAPFMLPAVG
jgi:hypothetical protein